MSGLDSHALNEFAGCLGIHALKQEFQDNYLMIQLSLMILSFKIAAAFG